MAPLSTASERKPKGIFYLFPPKVVRAFNHKMTEVKEHNWWITGTQHIRSVLKSYIDAYNATATKKLSGIIHVRVARALKDRSLFSSTTMPSHEHIVEAFKKEISDHEEVVPEAEAGAEAEAEAEPTATDRIKAMLSELKDDEEIVIYRRTRSTCCCGFW